MAYVAPSKPPLVDHLGRTIDFSKLKEEISAPTLGGVRSIISGHPASGLTPSRLSGILRSAECGEPSAYLELAEEMEEKDLHYLGVLGTRKRQVAQLDITVEAATDDPDDQANADLVRDWLDRDTLQDDLFDIMDAIGKGVSASEIVWETSENQWWPGRLELVLPQWLIFDRVTGKELLLRDSSGYGQPLDPFKYVVHQVKAKSGLPIRGGLARPVAWAWMFKNFAVKDWVAFCEVYGMPLRIGKYEPGATPEDKRTLLRAVTDISSDAAAIIPKTMEIDLESGPAGADGKLFEASADWFDRQVSKAVLGQTGTTDMQKGGGYAQSKTLDGVREDIEVADAKSLAATLRRDIVKPLIDLNRGPPKSGKYPSVRIGRSEQWDPAKMMPAVESFVGMGGRVEASVVRDRLGLPDPPKDKPDVELLKPVAPALPAGAVAAPEKTAVEPGKTPAAPIPANDARAAASALFRLLTAAAASGGGPVPAKADAIDALLDDELGGWEQLLGPLITPVETVVAGASSLQDLRGRLVQALDGMDDSALTTLLANASFNARLAGLVGFDLAGADPSQRSQS
jgi:phage gp29-like protein